MDGASEIRLLKGLIKPKNLIVIAVLLLVLGAGAAAGLVKASDNPAFCQICHIMKPYYESWHDGDLLASKHAEAGVTCHECHHTSVLAQAEEGLKFITGNYQNPLEQRKFSREFCLVCHDFQEVKTVTDFEESNPHDSHNGEQDCNLCHSMHRQSQVMCAQCHQFAWTDELDDSWAR